MRDTAFLLCERELKLDFQEIGAFHQVFLKTFSAKYYVEENEDLALINPQAFVAEYQETVDVYLQNQILRCQRILISRKYLPFILLNKEKFYDIYSDKYQHLFVSMDISLAKESQIIQAKIVQIMKDFKDQEVH